MNLDVRVHNAERNHGKRTLGLGPDQVPAFPHGSILDSASKTPMDSIAIACKICGNQEGNRPVLIADTMFGTGESFAYTECATCGCLQINEVPANLGDYYSSEYYSLGSSPFDPPSGPKGRLMAWATKLRTSYALTGKGFLGKRVFERRPDDAAGSLRHFSLSKDARILDVGCGSGRLLSELSGFGFHNLEGIDVFRDGDAEYLGGRVRLWKRSIHEHPGQFDLVMMHHAFEHVADPEETLKSCARLLADGGKLLIRTPTTSSFLWKEYGAKWHQTDAPRHLFIHSIDSMRMLADRAGLELSEIMYDSGPGQFWATEQTAKGIPSSKAIPYADAKEIGPHRRVSERAEAEELNQKQLGDQACFIFMKKSKPGS